MKLGRVDKGDSEFGVGMIQGCLSGGGGFDSGTDERRGMGVLLALCRGERRAKRASARSPSPHAGWHLLDHPHRRTVARSARGTGQVELGLSPVPALEPFGVMGFAA